MNQKYIVKCKKEKEVWRDIPGYEGLYKISDLSTIKSLDRITIKSNGVTQKNKGIILNQYNTKNMPYYVVSLSKNGKVKPFDVHKLMAISFMNHPLKGSKKVIDHINKNKLDNRLVNLQIITNRQNTVKGLICENNKVDSVGVKMVGRKFISSIRPTGQRQIRLGSFSTEKDASNTYQIALRKILSNEDFCIKSEMTNKEWVEYLLK